MFENILGPWGTVLLLLAVFVYLQVALWLSHQENKTLELERYIRETLVQKTGDIKKAQGCEYLNWLIMVAQARIVELPMLKEFSRDEDGTFRVPLAWRYESMSGPAIIVVGVFEESSLRTDVRPTYVEYLTTNVPGQPIRIESKLDGSKEHELMMLDGSWAAITESQAHDLVPESRIRLS